MRSYDLKTFYYILCLHTHKNLLKTHISRCFKRSNELEFTAAAALEMLRLRGYFHERPDAPDIAIVITDGLSRFPTNTLKQVHILLVSYLLTCVLFYELKLLLAIPLEMCIFSHSGLVSWGLPFLQFFIMSLCLKPRVLGRTSQGAGKHYTAGYWDWKSDSDQWTSGYRVHKLAEWKLCIPSGRFRGPSHSRECGCYCCLRR